MADFAPAYAATNRHEGGWVNDVSDPGGETYRGIARRRWPNWPGWATVDRLRADTALPFPGSLDATPALQRAVEAFYQAQFWDAIRGSEVPDQGIASELYDTSVNMGVGTAVLLLQRSLNALARNGATWPMLRPDAHLGAGTMQAISAAVARGDAPLVVKVLNHLQGARYVALAEANPALGKFMRGWMART